MIKRCLLLLLFIPLFCHAQEFGFGFGDYEDGVEDNLKPGQQSLLPFTLTLAGEIEAGPTLFVHDFSGDAGGFSVWDMLSAKLNFTVSGKNAKSYISLNLSQRAFAELMDNSFDPYTPMILDEMWLAGYFDRVVVEAGLMKLRWGRMYSPGPLDVVNPLDYSDLTNITESRAMKIARPMVHASYRIGDFSEVEAVFLPNFAGHRFAKDGRWMPDQYSNMEAQFSNGVLDRAIEQFSPLVSASQIKQLFNQNKDSFDIPEIFPDTSGVEYFQTGLRFNTVIAQSDLGFQYFYGNMFRPSVTLTGVDDLLSNMRKNYISGKDPFSGSEGLISSHIEYSRYHQIGVDYSQVLSGFTVRAEFAANITEDTTGEDGKVKNPFLSWAIGFDRDIFAGVNINIQCNESIRLLDENVTRNPALDSEGASDVTSTRLIVQIQKNFFRDKMECKLVNIWGIEDFDCLIVPSVAWSLNDTCIELSAGIFAGDNAGELGQYWENSYIKLKVRYSF
ncbi:MAG: hypothetical protein LBH44_10030 [Treponema sp.]|jgi:hypothetical protein|nr:hypothetical protein [Treponema sp.]